MKFLNKKEQVIDLQITQFGKRLLSTGQFRPIYYAFSDDGVLYDPQHAGYKQAQNDIQNRIISETPQLECQYVFSGIETKVKEANKLIRLDREQEPFVNDPGTIEVVDQSEFFQLKEDKFYALTSILGTSEFNSNKLPAWNISFINGKISGSVNVQNTGSCSRQIINIPEITPYDITYNTRVITVPQYRISDYEESSTNLLYGDKAVEVIERDTILVLEIDEENTEFLNENFDIEVFEIGSELVEKNSSCTSGETKEVLTPLCFVKPFSPIENGIIKSEDEIVQPEFRGDGLDLQDLEPTFVEYYFDILVDNEIPKDVICKYIKNDGKGIFSQRVLDCEEFEQERKSIIGDLYGTDVDDDMEDCP